LLDQAWSNKNIGTASLLGGLSVKTKSMATLVMFIIM